jgi:hypothetical protein
MCVFLSVYLCLHPLTWTTQFGLEQQLCLFARDEVMTWMHGKGHPWTFDLSFRTSCAANIEGVVKRAEIMACKIERETVGIRYESYVSSCSDCHTGPIDHKYGWYTSRTHCYQPDLDGYESCAIDEDE